MSSGNSSVETLLKDAEKLVTRLKAHEKAADCLLGQADGLHKTIKAKSSYMKEISALNEVARHRPRSELVLGIQMENQQIRRLQGENRDLRMLIDEHQSAVDVIMTKYREQMALIVAAKKMNRNGNSQNEAFLDNALRRKRSKIDELASVMTRAIDLDEGVDERSDKVIEKLKTENRILRETLKICEKRRSEVTAAGVDDGVGADPDVGVCDAKGDVDAPVKDDSRKSEEESSQDQVGQSQVKTESNVYVNRNQKDALGILETVVSSQGEKDSSTATTVEKIENKKDADNPEQTT